MKRLVQIISILFLFFYFQLLPAEPAAAPTSDRKPFYELIAVPTGLTHIQLEAQLEMYKKERHYPPGEEPIIVAVPQVRYIPIYTPIPFHQPETLYYIAPPGGPVKFFDPTCMCESDPEVSRLKKALEQQRLQLERLLSVRSALYNYYLYNKKLPASLTELTEPFPNNYLSEIPFQSSIHGNVPALEETGVIYRPELFNPTQAWQTLDEVFRVGGMREPTFPLMPLEVVVYQSSFRMIVYTGTIPVRSYYIGLGAENRTPLGTYFIKLKVNEPLSQSKVYGTRGLVLSDTDYAIHGTNNPASIGQAISKGCVRLHNFQVEELFSIAPIGTKVTITNNAAPEFRQPNARGYYLKARENEKNPTQVYHWKG
ncbi:L,D-transpeptidase-like protein [Aneurinibacillus soli]|uniref:Putative L,D-transpeptidase YkuD n=1 Tax=Aneurinibacillus soli TaxID=1500254 RepID=A0A0U4NL47_9BACL|nr:L,D-transpeptidase [Aneurinibacillus soli]PYE59898.1 L,D-transpeptidase-like protein [Aneurinibacillus soli]BAU29380.1 putative L,D-transpeptidase YkuD [Aneurinibacillus soli]